MSVDTINFIKEAEEKADDIKRQAILKAREIVFEAEKESDELLRKVNKDASLKKNELIAAAELEARSQIEMLKEKYDKQGKEISDIALKKMDEAVSLIVRKVVGQSGNR